MLTVLVLVLGAVLLAAATSLSLAIVVTGAVAAFLRFVWVTK
jgi:hypothetical protein